MRRLTVPLNTSSSEVTDESSLCLVVGGLQLEPEPEEASLPERRTMSAVVFGQLEGQQEYNEA